MRYAALLVGFYATLGCSLEHVVVAALDTAGSGGSLVAAVGGASSAGASSAGAASSGGVVSSAGSGGSLLSEGSRVDGVAGGVVIATGGVIDTPIIIGTIAGDGGGASETRCSCIGGTSDVCGTDGISYPAECANSGTCSLPGIACLQACPCPNGAGGDAGTSPSDWFTRECAPSAHCSEGVICMTFHNVTFNDQPTPCAMSN